MDPQATSMASTNIPSVDETASRAGDTTAPLSRKRFLGTAAAAAAAAAAGTGLERASAFAAPDPAHLPQIMRTGNPVTLTYLIADTPAELRLRQKVLAKFMAANPDIKVVFQNGGNAFHQKLNTAIAGGNPPDLIKAFELQQPDYTQRGVYMQLDPFYAHDSQFQEQVMAQQYPVVLDMFRYQGHVYAIPEEVNNVVLYYNRNHLKEAGLTMPSSWNDPSWTWDKFLGYAKKLTQQRGSRVTRYGYAELWWWPLTACSVLAPANGGYWFNKHPVNPHAGSSNLADPKIARAVQFYADLSNVHKVAPNNRSLEAQTGSQLLLSGRASMGIVGHWTFQDFAAAGLPFDLAPIPIGPDGGSHSATGLGGIGLAMSSKTKYPEQCWRFIKYWTGLQGETQFAASGLWVPTLRNVGQSAAYMKANAAVPHPGLFPDVLKEGYAYSLPITRAYPYYMNAWANTLIDQVWSGKQTARAVLPGLDNTINAAIKKYG